MSHDPDGGQTIINHYGTTPPEGLPLGPFTEAERALQRGIEAGVVQPHDAPGRSPLERKAENILTGNQDLSAPGAIQRQVDIVERRTRNLRQQITDATGIRPAVAKQLRRVRNLTEGGTQDFKQAGSRRALQDALEKLDELGALEDPEVRRRLEEVGVQNIQAVLEGPEVGTEEGQARGGSVLADAAGAAEGAEPSLEKVREAAREAGVSLKRVTQTVTPTEETPTTQAEGSSTAATGTSTASSSSSTSSSSQPTDGLGLVLLVGGALALWRVAP